MKSLSWRHPWTGDMIVWEFLNNMLVLFSRGFIYRLVGANVAAASSMANLQEFHLNFDGNRDDQFLNYMRLWGRQHAHILSGLSGPTRGCSWEAWVSSSGRAYEWVFADNMVIFSKLLFLYTFTAEISGTVVLHSSLFVVFQSTPPQPY